ncbi:MAG: ABC transporter ATP-binding protein [Myxococcota bacterium]
MIAIDALTYTYPGASEQTLHGLSFAIEDQEIFGFLGPSGAGKSTTQKILIGLLTGYHGTIQVMGRELRDWSHDYYEHVGVSFELPNHHTRLTARENLQHFGALYSGPIADPMEVLTWVGLAEDADKRVSDFSKGMNIRLNVARSLMHRPRLLFLDEPTSGLDPVNASHMKDLIRRVRDQGTTVFITTHDMNVADQLCDRVAFITRGHIRLIDAPATLKQSYGRRCVSVVYTKEEGSTQDPLHTAEFPLDNLADNQAFFDILKHHRIETMHTQETTLEGVFIEVTGEELTP